MLPPGRRHRDRPRAHHQGRVGAARRRRPPSSRARPLALEHLARAARPIRRGDGRAAPGRAARLDGAGRRRAGDGLRQSGQRDDAASTATSRRSRWPSGASSLHEAHGSGHGLAVALATLGQICVRLGDLDARRGRAAPRARRAQPDSVSRDDRRRVRHARADPPDPRHATRRPSEYLGARRRRLRRLRTADQPVVRMVGPRPGRAAGAAARRARRGGRLRRRNPAGRRAAVRRAAGDADRRRSADAAPTG